MGIGSWLKGALSGKSSADRTHAETDAEPKEETSSGCFTVSGTTTFAKDAVESLVERKQLGRRGYYEGPAQLQREPENKADPNAVAVFVEGQRVGYLPAYAAVGLPLVIESSMPARYQLHTLQAEKLLAKAYVWLGRGTPAWEYTQENPPALTSAERIRESHAVNTEMVREALSGGGERADQFKLGMVDGFHYLELIEPIKQLKREGRYEEALTLCYKAIEGAEKDARGSMPAPAYTEHAAIIHRKLSQKEEEVAVLKRWLRRCPADQRESSRIAIRLAKLEAK